MLANFRNPALLAVLIAALAVRSAHAQGAVGTPALGMAGAFAAVADDATAVYWNPAGIATGSFVSAVIDFGQNHSENNGFVGLSATALGLAYYRFDTFGKDVAEAAVKGHADREEV